MISNYIIRTKLESLKKEKSDLAKRKFELQDIISDTGITSNEAAKIKRNKTTDVPGEILSARKAAVKEVIKIDKKMLQLNNEIRELHRKEDSEKNIGLLNLFKEIFTDDQLREIRDEARRRISGDGRFRLSFSVKESVDIKIQSDKYRKLAKEQLEKMIEFRILLNQVIEKGIENFGAAEFLKTISPLNNLIMPVEELKKIKIKHLL